VFEGVDEGIKRGGINETFFNELWEVASSCAKVWREDSLGAKKNGGAQTAPRELLVPG
jgi:hypothetical protein